MCKENQPAVQYASTAHRYLRLPAGVDSTLLMAVPGFAVTDFFGIVAERATSLDFALATGADKVTIGRHDLNYLN